MGSLDADKLKWEMPICSDCNNRRTQPYDLAWETLSTALRGRRPAIGPGTVVRTDRIYRVGARAAMLDVHLFFAKQFGCYIADAAVPLPLQGFATSILDRKAHPNLYLKFASSSADKRILASGSHLHAASDQPTGEIRFAAWVYHIDTVEVMVMYAADGEDRRGLLGAWHPRQGTTRLVIGNFQN